eukprot:CAMPEP_0172514262 /NCGR_PEP_ID=MMETSP1066-20121228/258709_1 /TAXON_ID=671091 /ORGANISM="Coscinodiscus wailesii, Strain CCMP2513" /LENGTH=629 /DNA_ID=CAMNT_0013294859 /DNA_START=135 /DNA_END=2024 /DNA_ORIENTATION=+
MPLSHSFTSPFEKTQLRLLSSDSTTDNNTNDGFMKDYSDDNMAEQLANAETTSDFNELILAHTENKNTHGASAVFYKMCLDDKTQPNVETYSILLDYYTGHPKMRGHAARAQSLLSGMSSSSTSSLATPSLSQYKKVLKCWSEALNDHLFASRTHDFFLKMLDDETIGVDGECYRHVITAWCRSKETGRAFKATSLLFEMEDERSARSSAAPPTMDLYRSVLELWSTEEKSHINKAPSILERMETLHKREPTTSAIKPDLSCYKLVLKAWASNSAVNPASAGHGARSLIRRMTRVTLVPPDAECYAAVILALSRAASVVAENREGAALARAVEADEFLSVMEDMRRKGITGEEGEEKEEDHGELLRDCFCNVLRAYAGCRHPDAGTKAKQVLDRFTKVHFEKDTQPNAEMITLAITAWVPSSEPLKVDHAADLLRSMLETYHNESTTACNAFINVCIHATTTRDHHDVKREALLKAIRAVHNLKSSSHGAKPDYLTYRLLLTACIKLLPPQSPERTRAMQNVFKNACRDGLVDHELVKLLYKNTSLETYRKIVGALPGDAASATGGSSGMTTLPKRWSRNVHVKSVDGIWATIAMDGKLVVTEKERDSRMKGLRSKRNQKLLRGGRVKY